MSYLTINYESKALGMPVMISALIPQGRGNYKTLYLLHGAGGDYTTWITRSKVSGYVENTNIAVIMISANNKCYVDNVHGKKYFQFLTDELIRTCTNWFGLSTKREDTYIAGMSMGGYGAVNAALRKPEKYKASFCYSGLLNIKERYENPQGLDMYPIFGSEEDFNKYGFDLFEIIKNIDNKDMLENVDKYPKIYERCGLQDTRINMSRDFYKAAKEKGFNIDYYESCGGHDFEYWDKCIHETIEIIKGSEYRKEDIYGNNNEG